MIEYDPRRSPVRPFRHQVAGVRHLLSRSDAALFDEMGVGKSKQVVDAANTLFEAGAIRTVVVVAPAGVRSVWDDPEDGEIVQHSWVETAVMRYDARSMDGRTLTLEGAPLLWVVTNYEFLRARIKPFLKFVKKLGTFLLVCDESSRIKSRTADQTKAVRLVANEASRTWLLNGTPVANNLMDLWSQLTIMDPAAVHGLSFWEFRNHYAIMGGFKFKQVVGYHPERVERLKRHLKAWVIRREKRDCLDLPAKLYTQVEVPLDLRTWDLYKQMRDEMVVWLEGAEAPASVAPHGAVKALRLAQLCTGFLGSGDPDVAPLEVSREKLDAFLAWQAEHPERIIVWCRFTAELQRVVHTLQASGRTVCEVHGNQSAKKRDAEIRRFNDTPGAVLVGQPQAGGWGLNLQVAHTVVYLSNDYNLVTRLQSEDRAHRQGQKEKVTYVDFLATSPTGRRTVDHVIQKALLKKEDLAAWTYDQWRVALRKDRDG